MGRVWLCGWIFGGVFLLPHHIAKKHANVKIGPSIFFPRFQGKDWEKTHLNETTDGTGTGRRPSFLSAGLLGTFGTFQPLSLLSYTLGVYSNVDGWHPAIRSYYWGCVPGGKHHWTMIGLLMEKDQQGEKIGTTRGANLCSIQYYWLVFLWLITIITTGASIWSLEKKVFF